MQNTFLFVARIKRIIFCLITGIRSLHLGGKNWQRPGEHLLSLDCDADFQSVGPHANSREAPKEEHSLLASCQNEHGQGRGVAMAQ